MSLLQSIIIHQHCYPRTPSKKQHIGNVALNYSFIIRLYIIIFVLCDICIAETLIDPAAPIDIDTEDINNITQRGGTAENVTCGVTEPCTIICNHLCDTTFRFYNNPITIYCQESPGCNSAVFIAASNVSQINMTVSRTAGAPSVTIISAANNAYVKCDAETACDDDAVFEYKGKQKAIHSCNGDKACKNVTITCKMHKECYVSCSGLFGCRLGLFYYYGNGKNQYQHICHGEKTCLDATINTFGPLLLTCDGTTSEHFPCQDMNINIIANYNDTMQCVFTFIGDVMDNSSVIRIMSVFGLNESQIICINDCPLHNIWIIYGFKFDKACKASDSLCFQDMMTVRYDDVLIVHSHNDQNFDYNQLNQDILFVIPTISWYSMPSFGINASFWLSILCINPPQCHIDYSLSSYKNVAITNPNGSEITNSMIIGPTDNFLRNNYGPDFNVIYFLNNTKYIKINSAQNSKIYIGDAINFEVNCAEPAVKCYNVEVISTLDLNNNISSLFACGWDIQCQSNEYCQCNKVHSNATSCFVRNPNYAGCAADKLCEDKVCKESTYCCTEYWKTSCSSLAKLRCVSPDDCDNTIYFQFPLVNQSCKWEYGSTGCNIPAFNPLSIGLGCITNSPTSAPTSTPTQSSNNPSNAPSIPPTSAPSNNPTAFTISPSSAPSSTPTILPSNSPTQPPSIAPSLSPIAAPTSSPSQPPSKSPSFSPILPPTTAPTVPPTYSPSISPTYNPSKSPTFSPIMAPTSAPSTSPTRSPISTGDYSKDFKIIYNLYNLTEKNIVTIILNEAENIIEIITSYYVFIANELKGENFNLQFKQFEIIKIRLERKDQDTSIELETLIKYELDSVGTLIKFLSERQDYLDTTKDELRNNFENQLIGFKIEIIEETQIISTFDYVFPALLSMLVIMALISFGAAIYNKLKHSKTDNANWIALLLYGLQIFDIVSDVNLAIEIVTAFNGSLLLFISGYGSVIFIVIPYLLNIYITCTIKNFVSHNNAAVVYFEQRSALFVMLVVICGSTYSALLLVSSRIFGVDQLNSGLTNHELRSLTQLKLYGNVLLENIPQIICQLLYVIYLKEASNNTRLSFFSSFLTIIGSILLHYIQHNTNNNAYVTEYDLELIRSDKNEMNPFENRLILKKRERKKHLRKLITSSMKINETSIELGYVTITATGCIIHIIHIIHIYQLDEFRNNNNNNMSYNQLAANFIETLYNARRMEVNLAFNQHFQFKQTSNFEVEYCANFGYDQLLSQNNNIYIKDDLNDKFKLMAQIGMKINKLLKDNKNEQDIKNLLIENGYNNDMINDWLLMFKIEEYNKNGNEIVEMQQII